MKRQSITYWIYTGLFFAYVIGFIVSDFRDDLQKMVWFGFMGLIWYKLANDARVTE